MQELQSSPKILVVDDERSIFERIRSVGAAHGWKVEYKPTKLEALSWISVQPFDLVILDRMLNDGSGDGIELIASAKRASANVRFLILSALTSPVDRTYGLNSGADSYLNKPFDDDELAAHVHSVLRRSGSSSPLEPIRIGGLEIDITSKKVAWNDIAINFTPLDLKILCLLASNANLVVTRELMWEVGWAARSHGNIQDLAIEQCICRMRKALASEMGDQAKGLISAVRHRGYMMNIPATLN